MESARICVRPVTGRAGGMTGIVAECPAHGVDDMLRWHAENITLRILLVITNSVWRIVQRELSTCYRDLREFSELSVSGGSGGER